MVGASAVEIGTANFLQPDHAFRLARELPVLMRSLGIDSIDTFRGSFEA